MSAARPIATADAIRNVEGLAAGVTWDALSHTSCTMLLGQLGPQFLLLHARLRGNRARVNRLIRVEWFHGIHPKELQRIRLCLEATLP